MTHKFKEGEIVTFVHPSSRSHYFYNGRKPGDIGIVGGYIEYIQPNLVIIREPFRAQDPHSGNWPESFWESTGKFIDP